MSEERVVYRVQGLSCAGCAKTFEKNVRSIESVEEAEVNFGASKITVYGKASVAELEKAGAFDKIKIYPEHEERQEEKEPFWKRHLQTILSALFLSIGWVFSLMNGEQSILSIGAFFTSTLIGGWRLFQAGLQNLIRLQFDMKTLMTIAVIGASIIGEWGEGATVVLLFAISEALESYSMDRARRSIQTLMDIAPKKATIFRRNNEMVVHVNDIQVGDILHVKPGEKIAMDGEVLVGSATVNEAAITGESIPVLKSVGDEVFAGTLNEDGNLKINVTKTAKDNTIAKVIQLVEEAQAERAPSQAFIDRFAKYYTPIIMVVALLVAIIPPILFQADWQTWIYQGLAVLVVGCPCALVISTPVAVVTAIGNAARNGVLMKGGIYLEQAGKLQAIAFDKTGTLTEGKPKVTHIDFLTGTMEDLGKMAALENLSQHPLAKAVVQYAHEQHQRYEKIEVMDFASITGKGIVGTIEGKEYVLGSPNFVEEKLKRNYATSVRSIIKERQEAGNTVILFADKDQLLLVVSIADTVRHNSQSIIHQLHQLGVKQTIMLTGDNRHTANAVAKQIGVLEVKSELLPHEKVEVIKQLRTKFDDVAMVGDGVNDAPALAASTVGFAMGASGTDTALETADVALMGDDLKKLPFTIRLSRKALAIIKQNVAFSIGIKILALLLVVPGWLTLWIAIFADMGATLLVTLNALRLLRVRDIAK
ncbi:heavy metal translocating P-type ATPase [Bacillus sp. FJAT-47783]|uniref:heavy metal translocating P-type ATPase n=1 Tax=Bacillus sp. FJAT-47783 TaxID=2922712 RepID=UPI001FAB72AD